MHKSCIAGGSRRVKNYTGEGFVRAGRESQEPRKVILRWIA